MKKTAVIYFSLEGNTKLLADVIAKKTQADVFVVKAKKTYHEQGFKKFFWGGKSVFFNEIPELESLTFDANQYERIFIGTPIWVGTMAPPIKSFCYQYPFSGKEVQLFCTHGGGKYVKFEQSIKELLPDNQFAAVFAQKEPVILKQEVEAQQACQAWIDSLEQK
ncbi:MAG: flavodoxin [Culicoidibacterales bacterium]